MKALTLLFFFFLLAAPPPAAAQAPGIVEPLNATIVGEYVRATAVQADGKIIIAGKFSSVHRTSRGNIARLNPDGSLDTTFDVRTNDWIYSVAIQPDGKILIAGHFTTIKPNFTTTLSGRSYIARLHPNGTLDTGFDPRPDYDVTSLALQADGKILIGGFFFSLSPNGTLVPTLRVCVARLFPDGTLDPGFFVDPGMFDEPNDYVYSIAVQEDGMILIGGNFANPPPLPSHIMRVTPDGVPDPTFQVRPNNYVNCIALQADGRILIGGAFNAFLFPPPALPVPRCYIARLSTTGFLETTFNPNPNGFVECLAVQADKKILLGGSFTTMRPNNAVLTANKNHIARINADGSLDTAFNTVLDNHVASLTIQADGEILVGGYFEHAQEGAERKYFARLSNGEATQTLSVPDPTTVLWQRGGTSPEAEFVTFELSVDGGTTWILLGTATRVPTTSDWQLTTAAPLPENYHLRARARTSAGNRGFSQVESVLRVGLTSRETWNQTWFGSPESTGPAAPDGDPNGNGIPNLMEYALGGDPAGTTTGGTILPVITADPLTGRLQLTFERYPDRDDITITIQAADDTEGPWEDAARSVNGAAFTILVAGYTVSESGAGATRDVTFSDKPDVGAARRFLRVKVTES